MVANQDNGQGVLELSPEKPKHATVGRAVRRPMLKKQKEPEGQERGKIHPMEGEPECPRRSCRGVNHRYFDWNLDRGITAECQDCWLVWHPKSNKERAQR